VKIFSFKLSKELLIILVLFFVCKCLFITSSFAQDGNYYNVVSYKGDILCKGKDQKWKKIKQGESLSGDDVLKVKKDLYITLFDKKNQQYLIINGERTIRIRDSFSNPNNNRFTSLVDVLKKAFDDFTNVFNPQVFESQVKTKLRATNLSDKLISISPRKSKVFSQDIQFRWLKSGKDTTYRFILLDENFKTVLDSVVYRNCLSFKKTGVTLEKDKEYIWRVYVGKDPKEFKELSIFKMVGDDEEKIIKNNLDSLDMLFPEKNDPSYYALRGLVLEGQSYYSESLENYLKATNLVPDDARYEYLIDRLFEKMNLTIKYSDVFKR
jgi:hypothetical protein